MKAQKAQILHRKISTSKYRLIVRCFIADCTILQTAKITQLNRNTITRYYKHFRQLIVSQALVERNQFHLDNGIEIDESYFGAQRVRGKRGRGAGRKILVLGLLKREGMVFTKVISRASQAQIMPIIRKVVRSGSDIYTDGWKSYDALAVYGYNHKQVKHSEDEFVNGDSHINGIESFWSYTKRRLAKFNGIKRELFSSYLLESEWRFNHRKTLEESILQLVL